MTETDLNAKVENNIEWRKLLWRKMETLETAVHSYAVEQAKTKTEMKVRFSMIGVIFGSISGGIMSIIVGLITYSLK